MYEILLYYPRAHKSINSDYSVLYNQGLHVRQLGIGNIVAPFTLKSAQVWKINFMVTLVITQSERQFLELPFKLFTSHCLFLIKTENRLCKLTL